VGEIRFFQGNASYPVISKLGNLFAGFESNIRFAGVKKSNLKKIKGGAK